MEWKKNINSNKMNCFGGKLCNLKLRKFYNLFFFVLFLLRFKLHNSRALFFVCAQIGSFPSHQSSSRFLKDTRNTYVTPMPRCRIDTFHRNAWVCVGISTFRSVFVTLNSWNEWIFDSFNFPMEQNIQTNAMLLFSLKLKSICVSLR